MRDVIPSRLICAGVLLALTACKPPAAAALQQTASTAMPEPPTPTPQPPPLRAAEPSREGWNDAQIEWLSFKDGLAKAKAENKPLVLVMHADWCGHCKNFSHVFEDRRVAEAARDFVMTRIDVDHEPEVAARYAIDGTYVPRTFFIRPDGNAMSDVIAGNDRFHYFYNERDPGELLASMTTARSK